MIPPNAMQIVRKFHATYVERSRYEVAYNLTRENQWCEWCKWGEWKWTGEDLALVIGYLRAQIRNDKRNDGALKFGNLIGMPDKFEEDLALAREAAKRTHAGKGDGRPKTVAQPAEEQKPMDAAEAAARWQQQFKKTL